MPDLRKLSLPEKMDLGRELLRARVHRGLTLQQVADEFDLTYDGCRSLIYQAAQVLSDPSMQAELRAAAAAEYEQILKSYKGPALDGDKDSAAVWLKAADQRDKLLGLRVPVEQRVTSTSLVAHVEARDRDAIIARLLARQEEQAALLMGVEDYDDAEVVDD